MSYGNHWSAYRNRSLFLQTNRPSNTKHTIYIYTNIYIYYLYAFFIIYLHWTLISNKLSSFKCKRVDTWRSIGMRQEYNRNLFQIIWTLVSIPPLNLETWHPVPSIDITSVCRRSAFHQTSLFYLFTYFNKLSIEFLKWLCGCEHLKVALYDSCDTAPIYSPGNQGYQPIPPSYIADRTLQLRRRGIVDSPE